MLKRINARRKAEPANGLFNGQTDSGRRGGLLPALVKRINIYRS